MLAPQLVPSAFTNSVPVILQFPIPQPRDSVRSLRHMTTQLLQEAAQVIPNQQILINVVSLKEIIAGKLAFESLEGSADGA